MEFFELDISKASGPNTILAKDVQHRNCYFHICDRACKNKAVGTNYITPHHVTGHFSVLQQNICNL